jgi:hypothetical protein
MHPRNSYRPVLERRGGGAPRLEWIGEEGGEPVRLTTEPETSFWRRSSTRIMGWFVPEDLL